MDAGFKIIKELAYMLTYCPPFLTETTSEALLPRILRNGAFTDTRHDYLRQPFWM